MGLLAQRRSLISITAQRRLCKIALPSGRFHFLKADGQVSREYLLVPVISLLSRRGTAQFRRTITLTVFLLPRNGDQAPSTDAADLAALCQQAVWNAESPRFPRIVGRNRLNDRPGLIGRLFTGPITQFVPEFNNASDRYLPRIFDELMRTVFRTLEIEPRTVDRARSVQTLIAISRARSMVFGSVLQVDAYSYPTLWSQITKSPPNDLTQDIGSLLSVNAARPGREWLIGGEGFRLERMRVTNEYEQDTDAVVLYNPMSHFMIHVMPKARDEFPVSSLKFGLAWLNFLAGTISGSKEILRAYRYRIEDYRNRVERVSTTEDPGRLQQEIHQTTLGILEELDVVSSFELVTPSYKAAHGRMVEMEGIAEERDALVRELEMMTALIRAEEADRLAKDIARSTGSTDNLTFFVVAFSVLSLIGVVNVLVDFFYDEPVGHTARFWSTLW